ncbi:probable indole-3-pyruvate monooxygenase YUCCA10 [Dioscorea cayenensis subsp. rotundata]|uniref:indole-3-pyruvate monooxygenase n=1 Tax=Dioscorea cayennensis subsp. rotundata TaxID=55577 RepID=A0AB40BP55_DIOCR|nr:probable indole-3-pyruvate monooxygenase YUCCA10 [Dioscorea cayenensis subsp. rotundata]
MEATTVVIVGAGSAGLATAACLTTHSIPYILLERDHCLASLWRNRAYDRVTLHLAKQYCQLPHAPYPASTPTFMPKRHFIEYLEGYAAKFRIQPRFGIEVESAWFEEGEGKWRVMARKGKEGEVVVELKARFMVVASGENDEAVVPEIEGLDGFVGDLVHSNRYRSGSVYKGKSVLVVGAGNSGMEIAFDLYSFGAFPSIVVRSPVHVVSKEIWLVGMLLLKYLSITWVDIVVLLLCYFKFGSTSKYGLCRPSKGPFYSIANTQGFFPMMDTGTFAKIKSGEIQVLPSIASIKGNSVTFVNGKIHHFDAIIFATGYRSAVKKWLKDDDLIGDDGMTKEKFPNQWKGKNGLYCAGLGRRGLYGGGVDALKIAQDINTILLKE